MIVPPIALGNVDPDFNQRVNGPGGPVPIGLVEVEAYPNPAPRKCIWAMLLLSSLLVLRVNQDRYAEVVHWHGGVPDSGQPFPWELQSLVAVNDTYESTFLAPPMLRRASTFLQSQPGASMVVTGLSRAVLAGDGDASAADKGGVLGTPGVSAVLTGTVSPLPRECPKSNVTPCYVGVQRIPPSAMPRREEPWASACHRFVAGTSLSSMRPLVSHSNHSGGLLCTRSKNVHAAVATDANGTVALAWDPPFGRPRGTSDSTPVAGMSGSFSRMPFSCLATVSFPKMDIIAVAAIDWASTVLSDDASQSVITVGFSGTQTLVVNVYDTATLKPRWRYRLPLSVAWLLRAPRVSDGYLLFVGSEQPFIGTIFVVDLRNSEVYEQDPPPAANGRRRPRRRRLPRAMFVERISSNSASSNLRQPRPSGSPPLASGQPTSGSAGPCAAVMASVVASAPRSSQGVSPGGAS